MAFGLRITYYNAQHYTLRKMRVGGQWSCDTAWCLLRAAVTSGTATGMFLPWSSSNALQPHSPWAAQAVQARGHGPITPPWSSTEPAKAPPPRRPGGAHKHTNNQTPAGQHTTTTNTRRRPQASSSAMQCEVRRREPQAEAKAVQSGCSQQKPGWRLSQHWHSTCTTLHSDHSTGGAAELRSARQCSARAVLSALTLPCLSCSACPSEACRNKAAGAAPPTAAARAGTTPGRCSSTCAPSCRPCRRPPPLGFVMSHRVRHADRGLRLGPLRRQQLRRRGRDVGETVAASHVERERADRRCLELWAELVDAAVVDPRVPAVRIRQGQRVSRARVPTCGRVSGGAGSSRSRVPAGMASGRLVGVNVHLGRRGLEAVHDGTEGLHDHLVLREGR